MTQHQQTILRYLIQRNNLETPVAEKLKGGKVECVIALPRKLQICMISTSFTLTMSVFPIMRIIVSIVQSDIKNTRPWSVQSRLLGKLFLDYKACSY